MGGKGREEGGHEGGPVGNTTRKAGSGEWSRQIGLSPQGTPMAPLFSTGRERSESSEEHHTLGHVGSTVTSSYKSTNPISHKSARNMLADWLAQETCS